MTCDCESCMQRMIHAAATRRPNDNRAHDRAPYKALERFSGLGAPRGRVAAGERVRLCVLRDARPQARCQRAARRRRRSVVRATGNHTLDVQRRRESSVHTPARCNCVRNLVYAPDLTNAERRAAVMVSQTGQGSHLSIISASNVFPCKLAKPRGTLFSPPHWRATVGAQSSKS